MEIALGERCRVNNMKLLQTGMSHTDKGMGFAMICNHGLMQQVANNHSPSQATDCHHCLCIWPLVNLQPHDRPVQRPWARVAAEHEANIRKNSAKQEQTHTLFEFGCLFFRAFGAVDVHFPTLHLSHIIMISMNLQTSGQATLESVITTHATQVLSSLQGSLVL